VTIYDANGEPLAGAGTKTAVRVKGADLVRRTEKIGSSEFFTLYAPLEIQGRPEGMVAVRLLPESVFSSVRDAGMRLAFVLLIAMAGIVGIGALLSRYILAQVRPLLATNRALGKGELSARAPIVTDDELGELARGVNQMAEQLEASYETLELRVAQRTEEVQRLLKERTEFFASLSHELRTPLAIILGQAKMLRDPSYRKNLASTAQTGKTIDNSAQQLLSLVNDVLDLARAEAGKIEVNLEKVNVSEVVKDMRRTIEGLAQANGLRVGINVARDLPPVKADRARLREILLNLVDNAVKYTPEGGKVELSAAAQNGEVQVSVSDTGVGIPPEAGALIFEPFYRVPGIAAQHGQASSGLGLAMAKRLVEAQGGSISFLSEKDAGSTFTFSLKPIKSRPQRIGSRGNQGGKPRPR
jgi:signal transduction histidine kinase